MTTMENKAAEANAQLAAIRATPHNGKMYQADDVDYLLALAETQGRGLGAINPQWFRDQANLVKGTLSALQATEQRAAESERQLRELICLLTDKPYGERSIVELLKTRWPSLASELEAALNQAKET
jgi:hypothetical protein